MDVAVLVSSFLNVGIFGSPLPTSIRCVPGGNSGSNFARGSMSAARALSMSLITAMRIGSNNEGSFISWRKASRLWRFVSESENEVAVCDVAIGCLSRT